MVDWPKLLDQHGIEYVESGPSTAKGNVYVHCPWCGDADQGHHMGISLRGRGWGCWKNDNHRGRNAARLLSALLNVSMEYAGRLVGEEGPELIGDEAVAPKLRKLLGAKTTNTEQRTLQFPKEFKKIIDRGPGRRFCDYLLERGYTYHAIPILCRWYRLHYALSGLFRYRIIFPVYTNRGLVTWTGRTIVPGITPRYNTLTTDPEVGSEGMVAKESIKNCLFNERELLRSKGKILVVGEGPFDAMRLDYVGQWYCDGKVRGTGLFGKTVSDAQLETLAELSKRFERKILLLDPDAALGNLAMFTKLSSIGFKTARLGGSAKDPAEASIKHLQKFFYEVGGREPPLRTGL